MFHPFQSRPHCGGAPIHRLPFTMVSLTLLTLATGLPLLASEADGEALIITPDHSAMPRATTIGNHAHDSAELLRRLPGVSGSRLGGMGIDPIMRGQGEGGVGIQANGGTIIAGCPNRMDPPTSYYNPALFDAMVVERGLRSLAHGLPTPGGSVRLERRAHIHPDHGEPLHGHIATGWNSIDDGRQLSADVTASHRPWALRTLIAANEAGDYDDGNGDRVSAAHRSTQASMLGAWQVAPDWLGETEVSISDHRDVRFPGAGMDSPKSTARMANARVSWQIGDELLRQSQLRVHYSEVDHLMDNYSLREQANPTMRRKAPSDTQSLGAAWALDVGPEHLAGAGTWNMRVGLDGQRDRQAADLINAANNQVISRMWNDVVTDSVGVYAEGLYGLTDGLRLEASLRVDWWRMGRDQHNTADNAALITHYASQRSTIEEVLPAAILGLQYDAHDNWKLRLAGSMAHRPATATEGFFMRRPGPMPGMWHLGNPTLKPERHQMLDVSISGEGDWLGLQWSTSAELFYDRVSNAIRQIKTAVDQPTLYDNTDIDLMGAVWEGSLSYELRPGHELIASADASYTRGRNRQDGSGVARIAPTGARISLDWDGPNAGLGIWARGEYRQHRFDPLRDTGPSSSWGIMGVQGHYDLTPTLRLRAGIDNLFNRAYAYHLSRENVFDETDSERVNEPGRNLWVSGQWDF